MPRIAATHLNAVLLASGLHDFFHSSTWHVIRNLSLLLVAIFWVATAYWVYKDARRRIEDLVLVGVSTLLGLVLPFLGPLIYMLFRPPEYLEDVRELQGAARGAVADLPVLRDADRDALDARAAAAPDAAAGATPSRVTAWPSRRPSS